MLLLLLLFSSLGSGLHIEMSVQLINQLFMEVLGRRETVALFTLEASVECSLRPKIVPHIKYAGSKISPHICESTLKSVMRLSSLTSFCCRSSVLRSFSASTFANSPSRRVTGQGNKGGPVTAPCNQHHPQQLQHFYQTHSNEQLSTYSCS